MQYFTLGLFSKPHSMSLSEGWVSWSCSANTRVAFLEQSSSTSLHTAVAGRGSERAEHTKLRTVTRVSQLCTGWFNASLDLPSNIGTHLLTERELSIWFHVNLKEVESINKSNDAIALWEAELDALMRDKNELKTAEDSSMSTAVRKSKEKRSSCWREDSMLLKLFSGQDIQKS